MKPDRPLEFPVKWANAYLSEVSPVLCCSYFDLKSPKPIPLSAIFSTISSYPSTITLNHLPLSQSIMILHIRAFACPVLSVWKTVCSHLQQRNLLKSLSDITSHLTSYLSFSPVRSYPHFNSPLKTECSLPLNIQHLSPVAHIRCSIN